MTDLPIAIVTNNEEMLQNSDYKGVPIFSKSALIDLGSNTRNPLRQFIAGIISPGEDIGQPSRKK